MLSAPYFYTYKKVTNDMLFVTIEITIIFRSGSVQGPSFRFLLGCLGRFLKKKSNDIFFAKKINGLQSGF
jgi:hypothetical protein